MIHIFANPGSISEGTLDPQDLITAFANVLKNLCDDNYMYLSEFEQNIYRAVLYNVEELKMFVEANYSFFDWKKIADNRAKTLVAELADDLRDFAPPDHYFGAHERNGALFGFWRII